jgi:hypothetical protein
MSPTVDRRQPTCARWKGAKASAARTLLLASLAATFGALIYVNPASAQSGEGYRAFVEWCQSPPINGTHVPGPGYGRCEPGSSAGSSYDPNSWGAQLGTQMGTWMRRQLSGEAARDARQRRASELNRQGLATDDPWEKLRLYREARELWDLPVFRLNLMYALINVADSQLRSDVRAEQLDRIEQMLNEAEALNGSDLASFELHPELINSLHYARNRVAQQRAALASQAANAAALQAASTRISDIAGRIANEIGASETQGSSGLVFGDPSQAAVVRQSPPPLPPQRAAFQRGVPRLEEVENSPGYEAWLRGMDAVVNRDWVLAAAWFGTAQLRDPTNAAFQRAVDISVWTRDFYQRPEARAASALRVPEDSDLALLFPPSTPEQFPASAPESRATPEELRRRGLAAGAQTILAEDLDYIFRDTVAQRDSMVAAVPLDQRRQLAERGVTLPRANDWTDQLAPEVRGMVAELRTAMPPRVYGPPTLDAAPADRMDDVLTEMSNSAADEAIVRVLQGDLAAAERALNDPGLTAGRGQFARALELIQTWRGQAPTGSLTGLAPGGAIPQQR